MDSFIIVDMYIFIVIAFLWTPLIKDQILRNVVYKPYLLLLLVMSYVERIGLGVANTGGTSGKWDVSVFWLRWCWRGRLCPSLGGLGGVMSVCVVSLDYLCWSQVQVSVYCARRIPAHLRCTQCSILLHLIDICLLTCIFTEADIVNPDLFGCGSQTGISLDITRFYGKHCQPSSGSTWPACPPKTVIGPPLRGAGGVDTICVGFARPLWQFHRVYVWNLCISVSVYQCVRV